jgi:glycosyltransferase involved in cell wall biosynthesis
VLPSALLAAAIRRVPRVVYAAEVYDPPEAGRLKQALGGALCRYSGRLADVVANSSRVASQFKRARNLVTVTPTAAASLAGGDRSVFRERPEVGGASPLIVSVGNLTIGRGQDVLVRALVPIRARLPEARYLIAGEPHPRAADRAYAESLRRLTDELGLSGAVIFAGFVEDVADLYAAADIVVNPARFPEPFGRVALEAFVAGRPFVGTRVGAIPDVVRDGVDGLLVEPDDPEALAAAIVRLAKDNDLRLGLVEQGRRRVAEAFDEERATSEFVRFVFAAAGRS